VRIRKRFRTLQPGFSRVRGEDTNRQRLYLEEDDHKAKLL